MADFSQDPSSKESRRERKRISLKDRSKFKKTDWAKHERHIKKEALEKLSKKERLKRGRVLFISPEEISVDCEGAIFGCSLRGVLKKEWSRTKNILTVGDFVLFEPEDEKRGAIVYVEERVSVLSREEHLHRRQAQLIASNIDQTLITVSVVNPSLRPALIDRYIIAAYKGAMEPILVINKIDLLEEDSDEMELFKIVIDTYQSLGIQVICVSTKTENGLDTLKAIMKGKTSVFSGQSGVGKSSLINAMTGLTLTTGDIIKKTNRGMHTTTAAILIPLDCGGWCVDTPGIRSFGVWDLKKEDLDAYFPEIKQVSQGCKFPNCTHTHEPSCAVRKALEAGSLSSLRFLSYLKLFEELPANK